MINSIQILLTINKINTFNIKIMQLLYSSIQRMRTVKCQVLLKEKGESGFGEAVIQKKFNDDVKMHLKV